MLADIHRANFQVFFFFVVVVCGLARAQASNNLKATLTLSYNDEAKQWVSE